MCAYVSWIGAKSTCLDAVEFWKEKDGKGHVLRLYHRLADVQKPNLLSWLIVRGQVDLMVPQEILRCFLFRVNPADTIMRISGRFHVSRSFTLLKTWRWLHLFSSQWNHLVSSEAIENVTGPLKYFVFFAIFWQKIVKVDLFYLILGDFM